MHIAATAACVGVATLMFGPSALVESAGMTTLETVLPVPNVTATGEFYYDGSDVDIKRRLYYLGRWWCRTRPASWNRRP